MKHVFVAGLVTGDFFLLNIVILSYKNFYKFSGKFRLAQNSGGVFLPKPSEKPPPPELRLTLLTILHKNNRLLINYFEQNDQLDYFVIFA